MTCPQCLYHQIMVVPRASGQAQQAGWPMEPPVASRVTAYAGCGLSLLTLRCQRRDNHPLCLRSGDRTRLAIYSSAVTEGSALSARRIPNSISFVRSPVARYSCHARKARRAAHSSSGVRSAPCMLVGSVQRATWARSSAISYRLRQGPECHVTWTISWEAGAHDPPTLPNSTLTGSPLRVSTPYRPRRRIT